MAANRRNLRLGQPVTRFFQRSLRWIGRRQNRCANHKVSREKPYDWRNGFAFSQSNATIAGRSALQVAQAADCADWLPNDLLTKLDRCLMSHGLGHET